MSLILHLPLNKDLRNIGLSKINLTNNGATISENGVHEKCYSFNGSSNYLSFLNGVDTNSKEFSYCVWAYFNNSTQTQCLYSQRTSVGSGFAIFLISGVIRFDCGGSLWKTTTHLTANQWTHIVLTYKQGKEKKYYINGNLVEQCAVSSTSGIAVKATIGGSESSDNGVADGNFLNGKLNDIRVYDNVLPLDDVRRIYEGKFSNIVLSFPLNKDFRNIGLVNAETSKLGNASIIEDQNFGGCLQAGDGIQTANGVRCNTNLLDELSEQKFSCSVWVNPKGSHVHYNGTFFSSGNWNNKAWAFGVNNANTQVDMFGPGYNTYVSCNVPVNEWTNLISVYDNRQAKLYKNGQYVKSYTFQSSSVFSSDTTWCAIGRETYASGYFSFNGNIADLRVYNLLLTEKDIQRIYHQKLIDLLPSEYEKLEYIEGTGTQRINTGLKFNAETDYVKVTFKGNDTSNNGMIFANSGSKYFWLYYYSTGINVYADNGNGQKNVIGISRDLNKHIVEFKEKHYYIDGVDKGIIENSYTETSSNMYLFSYGGGYYFKGRIYNVEVKKSDGTHQIFIPSKRKSDNVIGMFDMVSRQFFTNSGTGDFNGA